jgi:hypothetical protein
MYRIVTVTGHEHHRGRLISQTGADAAITSDILPYLVDTTFTRCPRPSETATMERSLVGGLSCITSVSSATPVHTMLPSPSTSNPSVVTEPPLTIWAVITSTGMSLPYSIGSSSGKSSSSPVDSWVFPPVISR